ncbi:MAG: 2-phospho-L-lactate transferase CofD family protein [Candidatus Omnitrophota bacterium]
MRHPKKANTYNFFQRLVSGFLVFVFSLGVTFPPDIARAQILPDLLSPGMMVSQSSGYAPVLIKGITVHPENPLAFDFIIDTGDSGIELKSQRFRQESLRLVKYFLASLTVPANELWVNLSPYEEDRVIPQSFGLTEMGIDLLAQDYMLKQLTASLTYPEDELGKKFWKRVYERAYKELGTTSVPFDNFHKVWIVPQEALVYQKDNQAFVVRNKLKVMMEEDYYAFRRAHGYGYDIEKKSAESDNRLTRLQAKVMREIILPEIEKEVNEGKNFAQLRQIFQSMILATWFKKNLKESLLGQVYADQKKVKGVDVDDPQVKEEIYRQYVKAFEHGVYNYIKEDYDPNFQKIVPRHYFSGGAYGGNMPAVQQTVYAGTRQDTAALRNEVADVIEGDGKIGDASIVLAETKNEAASIEEKAKKFAGQGDAAMLSEYKPVVVAFGGPDGVLFEYDRWHKTSFEDAVTFNKFLQLLNKGVDVVIISDQRYFDWMKIPDEVLEYKLVELVNKKKPELGKALSAQGWNFSDSQASEVITIINNNEKDFLNSLKDWGDQSKKILEMDLRPNFVELVRKKNPDLLTNLVGEKGLKARLVEPLRKAAPGALQNLTVYASAGTFKITFDENGEEIEDRSYNIRNSMDSRSAEKIKQAIEAIVKEVYWSDYQKRPHDYREAYPAYTFEGYEPQVVLHKNGDYVQGLTVLYLPSALLGAHNPSENKGIGDIRKKVFEVIKERLSKEIHPYIWAHGQYTQNMRGMVSIDLRRRNTGKDFALREYMMEKGVLPSQIISFWSLDEYSGDQPMSYVEEITRFINSKRQGDEFFKSLGIGLGGIYYWLHFLLQKHLGSVSEIVTAYNEETARHPSLVGAKKYIEESKNGQKFPRETEDAIENLYEIYRSFALTFSEAPAPWTAIYTEAFELSDKVKDALNEFSDVFYKVESVESLFKEADIIFYKRDVDFKTFYQGVDPRAARNINTLLKAYNGDEERLKNDVIAAANSMNISIARVLSGYYQDRYVFRYKTPLFETLKSRAPPVDSKVVYLGGGGVATTTLLQKFMEKKFKELACIISSSDDGGSSKDIMMSLFKRFGFYFIPPGDDAGLNIFLSNDNFKIFTLFWLESQGKDLPDEVLISAQKKDLGKFRITADSIYPAWRERVLKELEALRDPAKKQEIEKALAKSLGLGEINIDYKSQRHLVFLTSLLSLGDLVDRDLVTPGIVGLNNASTANLLMIGDAYDSRVIREGMPVDKDSRQFLLHQMLELGDAQPVPVSYDYERSALIAFDKGGEVLETTQTRITDKAHNKLTHDLYFSHRTAEERMKRFDSSDDQSYPKAAQKAVEIIQNSEMLVSGNGSLWTSLMPVLMYKDVAQAVLDKRAEGAPVVFIAKIKSDLETAAIKMNDSGEAEVLERDGKLVLNLEQMNLVEQLKAVVRHIRRSVGRDDIELKDVFSHAIIANLSKEAIRILKEKESLTEKEIGALREGGAQVSKLLKGIQPVVTQEEKEYVMNQGLKIIEISDKDITGIEKGKPLYDNDNLYEVLKSIKPEVFADSAMLTKESLQVTPVKAGDQKAVKTGGEQVGGIDLNPDYLDLRIKRDGNGVPLPMSQQSIEQLRQIDGFLPVIINVTPIQNFPMALGLDVSSENEDGTTNNRLSHLDVFDKMARLN